MGLFDFFKKKASQLTAVPKRGQQEAPTEKTAEDIERETLDSTAYALVAYSTAKGDYKKFVKILTDFGYDKDQVIMAGVSVVIIHYYRSEKEVARKLFQELEQRYPDNENITRLYIEVMCTIDIPNDIEFVKMYRERKLQHNDFKGQYELEYQKGLHLKSMKYYPQAIGLWSRLNKMYEFSWNYYQTGIVQNLLGETDAALINIRKAIEMDPAIKEDAKTFFELDNLRSNPEFIKLIA